MLWTSNKTLLQSSTFDKNEGALLQHKLVNHFWKESLPRIVAAVGILVGSVVKKCKTLLQSSTFDKSEGALLQKKLVKNFWKNPLLLVAGLVDFVWGVPWFGRPMSPLPVTKWSPHRMWLPATLVEASRNSELAKGSKHACKALLEGELA